MISAGERDDCVHFSPLDPVLKFARDIARIGANFKSGEYDNLDFKRVLSGGQVCCGISAAADDRQENDC
jgi:hypothetical protein